MVKFDAYILSMQIFLSLTDFTCEICFLVAAYAFDCNQGPVVECITWLVTVIKHINGCIVLIRPIVELLCSVAYIVLHIKFVPSFNRTFSKCFRDTEGQ